MPNPVRNGMVVKHSKAEVAYEHPAMGSERCGVCIHFDSPNGCKIVEGKVQSGDWCRLFKRV